MSTIVNPSIFREYDIRGRSDVELTDEFVTDLGQAYGTILVRRSGRRMALGRDVRDSGERIRAAFEAGLHRAGIEVIDIGVVPTPMVYFALHTLQVDGGVVITGSHNPPRWNGFKMCLGKSSLYGDAIQELRRIIEAGDFESGAGKTSQHDLYPYYSQWITENIRPFKRPIKVVIDAGNGTGGLIAGAIYRALGADVTELFCSPDGRFPNHHPDPTNEANLSDLKARVLEEKAEVGIAFDGDADRIGAVDSRGRVVWGDQLLLFFGRALLETNPDARIVGEVKCSRSLYDGIRKAGGQAEMWMVGHSLIKARMKETGAQLAGEMSGHIFFADRYFGYDDAIYAGARLMEMLMEQSESLDDLVDALPPSETTPELRVSCSDEHKFAVVERASKAFSERYEVIKVDGARIKFQKGWGLIRASNTQPVLVLRFEAETQDLLLAYRKEVEDWLSQNAPEVDLEADTHH